MTIEEWLTAWDGLAEQRANVTAMFEQSDTGDIDYARADSARFDLWQAQSELAESAEQILRTLHANSTLPEGRGGSVWRHLDGSVCDSNTADDEGDTGVCDEHDRRVRFR